MKTRQISKNTRTRTLQICDEHEPMVTPAEKTAYSNSRDTVFPLFEACNL
jgi:hypothetical protein